VQTEAAGPVEEMFASPAYRAIRAAVARKMLDDPSLAGVLRVNDDPDGPLVIRTDNASSGEEPRWYEVTTEEAWPYLVSKHEPRYGKGVGVVIKIPPT
jgi:hypothetical protein